MFDGDQPDDRDFWADEPTRSFPRLGRSGSDRSRRPAPSPSRARRHGLTGQVPAVDAPAPPLDHARTGPADPTPFDGAIADADWWVSAPWDESFRGAPVPDGALDPTVPVRRRPLGDPLLRRLGVMVAATIAVVPFAATLRDGGVDGRLASLDTPAADAPIVDGGTLEISTSLPASAAPAPLPGPSAASTAGADTTVLDPKSLPPAVPVNRPAGTDATSTSGSVAPTAAGSARDSTTSAAPDPTVTVAAEPVVRVETVATTSTVPTCSTGYDVVPGDYWILIADKIDVTTSELWSVNGAGPDTPLYPGRTICVPAGASPTTTAPSTTAAPTTTRPPVTTTAPKPTTTTAPPAPTTTQAPATTLPQRSYSASEVEQIIRDVWPDDLEEEALRIARRESNLQPTARNFCCYGLFQLYWNVHKGWLAGIGVTSSAQLFDPVTNANAALALYYRSGGWGPWAVG